MTQAELIQRTPVEAVEVQKGKTIKAPSTALRILRYVLLRALALFMMVVVIVWLTIIVVNLGGFADEIKRANIIAGISDMLRNDPEYAMMTPDQREVYVETLREQGYEAAGLNEPFLLRSVIWLVDGLTLGWASEVPNRMFNSPPATPAREHILHELPKTLYMFATANVLLFVVTVALSLRLMRKPSSLPNKIVTALAPLSTIPSWIVGIVLYALLLRLRLFDLLAGNFEAFPSSGGFSLAYLPITLKFLLLPVSAIFISKFFHSIYSWRSFFMIYEQEPYVELARAKGLKPNVVERKYIVRAALPAVLTSFALVMAGLWQEVVILEQVFRVSGIGSLFVGAVQSLNIGLVVGCVTTFGYLLAITIFVLDITYALVDPRITVSTDGNTVGSLRSAPRRKFWERAPRDSFSVPREKFKLRSLIDGIGLGFRAVGPYLKEIIRTPSAVIGLVFILGLMVVAIGTVIAIPYDEAVARWRGDDGVWENTPKNAEPLWINWFTENDFPESMLFDSRNGDAVIEESELSATQKRITVEFAFDYPYGAPPEDLVVGMFTQYDDKVPFISMMWTTPDGREIDMGSLSVPEGDFNYYILQDQQLMNKLKVKNIPDITKAMFADPAKPGGASMSGTYRLRISGIFFDTDDPQMDVRLSLQGKVYGWAGTDAQNRDLMLPLLWGTPVALLFGIIGAFGTSILMVILAAISTWFGGWVDNLIQRLTEMNMILPFFPFAVLVFILYSKSIWVILAVTVLLSIFGSSIKTYRAMFLQTKQSPYIEAARSYGASDWRIIFVYLIPRVVVLLIPQIMILIPSYVFLEAALAALGVSDPFLPTWGKLIAVSFESLFAGNYYKVFAAVLLILTGYAFALVGFSVERRFRKDTEMV